MSRAPWGQGGSPFSFSSPSSRGEGAAPVCSRRRISRSTAAYFSSIRASRAPLTSPARCP